MRSLLLVVVVSEMACTRISNSVSDEVLRCGRDVTESSYSFSTPDGHPAAADDIEVFERKNGSWHARSLTERSCLPASKNETYLVRSKSNDWGTIFEGSSSTETLSLSLKDLAPWGIEPRCSSESITLVNRLSPVKDLISINYPLDSISSVVSEISLTPLNQSTALVSNANLLDPDAKLFESVPEGRYNLVVSLTHKGKRNQSHKFNCQVNLDETAPFANLRVDQKKPETRMNYRDVGSIIQATVLSNLTFHSPDSDASAVEYCAHVIEDNGGVASQENQSAWIRSHQVQKCENPARVSLNEAVTLKPHRGFQRLTFRAIDRSGNKGAWTSESIFLEDQRQIDLIRALADNGVYAKLSKNQVLDAVALALEQADAQIKLATQKERDSVEASVYKGLIASQLRDSYPIRFPQTAYSPISYGSKSGLIYARNEAGVFTIDSDLSTKVVFAERPGVSFVSDQEDFIVLIELAHSSDTVSVRKHYLAGDKPDQTVFLPSENGNFETMHFHPKSNKISFSVKTRDSKINFLDLETLALSTLHTPGENLIFSASSFRLSQIDGIHKIIFNAQEGQEPFVLEQESDVRDAITDPEEKFLYVLWNDNTIQKIDLTDGSIVLSFAGEKFPNQKLMQMSPSGKQLWTRSEDGVSARVWDLETGRNLRVLDNLGAGRQFVIRPDDREIALASTPASENVLRLLLQPLAKIELSKKEVEAHLEKQPSLLASLGRFMGLFLKRSEHTAMQKIREEGGYRFSGSAHSEDGRYLAIHQQWPSAVTIWDTQSGERLSTHETESDAPTLAISSQGRLLAYVSRCGDDDCLRVIETKTGQVRLELKDPSLFKILIRGLSFSPDESKLLVGLSGPSAALYDLKDGQRLWTASWQDPDPVPTALNLGMTADGSLVSIQSQNTLLLVDGKTGDAITSLETRASPASSPIPDEGIAAITSDGKYVFGQMGRGDTVSAWKLGKDDLIASACELAALNRLSEYEICRQSR